MPSDDFADPFVDKFEFADDIHDKIYLNGVERDVVDAPEFQRLFRLRQLGFVDLVYRSAKHTRGSHSIGACFLAKKLVSLLNENNKLFGPIHGDSKPSITKPEEVLISLAALVHDLPHGPFSHDIEKKTHLVYLGKEKKPTKVRSHYGMYDKHDNFSSNAALYTFLMDGEHSVLARILKHHSPAFATLLLSEGEQSDHLKGFVAYLRSEVWPQFNQEILPQLLFHLLIYEKPEEAQSHAFSLRTSFDAEADTLWGLGPKESWEALHDSWYQPFRHDIVGDTLSADLLDYLMRDQASLGMKNSLDLKLLESYVLVLDGSSTRENGAKEAKTRYRCAIDLDDHKRGTFRAERLNDIFRMLDFRHQIHEKAVFHRVVQSAVAMLSRAGLILGDSKPRPKSLYGLDRSTPALAGDDYFLQMLVNSPSERSDSHQTLPCKLSERRVFRPIMVIPGDRINILLRGMGNFDASLEHPLRELAAVVDSTFFSKFLLLLSAYVETFLQHAFKDEDDLEEHIGALAKADTKKRDRVSKVIPKRVIFWTTPYKQLYKDPAIQIRAQGITGTLEKLQSHEGISEALRSRVSAGLRDAETKNEGLWKLYVFLSDGLFYTGVLAKALNNHPCAFDADAHKSHLEAAQRVIVRVLRAAWQYWQLKKREIDLELPAQDIELRQLLGLFTSGRIAFDLGGRDIPQLVSAVSVEQYLHSDDVSNCRDVRYKFDMSVDSKSALEHLLPSSQREMVEQAMRHLALSDLKSEETAELVNRLSQMPDLPTLVQDVASRNNPVVDEKLRSLWLQELN